jgi:adenine-specific DNA-methyltransferase
MPRPGIPANRCLSDEEPLMPSRRNAPAGPTPVDAIVHTDKRANLPTADAHEFVTPEIESPVTVTYPREIYSPMLVWHGKEALDDQDLEADAAPIYIQEKVDPRVLIEHLRQTAKAGEAEPELTLFDTFDGLGEIDLVEFYRHEANWSNRMILGDSLQVMASLDSRERLRGKVQMIYVDPPYGIKFGSNWQVSARKRDVKDGKVEDIAREAEQIKAFRDTWANGMASYLSYLRDRLLVARDLLTDSGSVFVQIGDENVHLVRSLLDEVFGSENFVSNITFAKTVGATDEFVSGVADFLLWYGKDRERTKYRSLFRPKKAGGLGGGEYRLIELADGRRIPADQAESNGLEGRALRLDNLTSQSIGREKGEGAASWFPVSIDAHVYRPPLQSRWKTNEAGMRRLVLAGRVAARRNSLSYVRYLDDFRPWPSTPCGPTPSLRADPVTRSTSFRLHPR